ncbi:7046_t:CDS:2 [Funneliformis geosporum]|uniref:7046_t:CDS:1 n=1 Tax=Funneliformis geosporum TaxID=1117311 RepID=A0A9W4SIR7_9GLOM|nr:7046_t:CDS:2 [Funneliformis geosporum]
MLYLLVQVNKSIKCVIPEHAVSIESTANKFSDLFGTVTARQYDNREVLNSDLKMLEVFGFLQIRFCLIININSDTSASTQSKPNAFSILNKNSRQTLLSQYCIEYNNYNQLYNEIIELFQAQNVG